MPTCSATLSIHFTVTGPETHHPLCLNALVTLQGAAQKSVRGGFPCGSAGKESACNAGDLGSIPGMGRSPGEGKLPTPVFWPGEYVWEKIPQDTTKMWYRQMNNKCGKKRKPSQSFPNPVIGSPWSPLVPTSPPPSFAQASLIARCPVLSKWRL